MRSQNFVCAAFFCAIIVGVVDCGREPDVCTVNEAVELSFVVNPSIKDSPNLKDADPDNDFKDLSANLFAVPGEYAITLKVGDAPEQRIEAVVDTGSTDLILNGSTPDPCSNCDTRNNTAYQPGDSAIRSSTSFPAEYGSANITATVFTDDVGLICGDSVPHQFGVITRNNPLPKSKKIEAAPNILGLGLRGLGRVGPSFFDSMVTTMKTRNVFSILLCGRRSGSKITLGGIDANVDQNAIKWTPVVGNSGHYNIEPTLFSLGDKSIGEYRGRMILDSGSTLSHFPATLLKKLVAELKSVSRKNNLNIPDEFWATTQPSNNNYVIPLSDATLKKLPVLKILFKGADQSFTLEYPPAIYLKELSAGNRIFSFRLAEGSLIVLGQPIMENYYVVFDREKTRIGFAPNTGLCR